MSDIENWELSNVRVEVDGQLVSFLADTVRNGDGSLTVDFGTYFSKVELVLKRTVFDGMKQEEEEIIVEVEIQRLMEKTLAAAGKDGYDASANVREWQALGRKALGSDPVKYRAAEITHWNSDNPPFELGATVEESFLSLQTTSLRAFVGDECPKEWFSDLPCLQYIDNSPFAAGPIEVFDAKMPNIVDGSYMFKDCQRLSSFSSEMPSLTNAHEMFSACTGLTSFNDALPSLTDASWMFYGCSGLRSFSIPSGTLPNTLTNASQMFCRCSGLNSWNVALPDSITDASGMFYGCYGLTSFQSNMPASLTTNAREMFYGCKLDITSVERISRTIANCTATYDWDKNIHLGVSRACHDDSNFEAYIKKMSDPIGEGGKGWNVIVGING